jgi:transposase
MSPSQEPNFAAFIAIDWADREHAWAMQMAGSTERETGKFQHTPEAIDAWAMQWAKRFDGRPVAVALEQARGALIFALSRFPHLVLYPIHPSTSHDYRKAMFPSGSKDDPKDAGLLLDLLTLHRGRLRALQPDTEQTRQLQILVEKRRQLVDDRTAHTNRATEQLKLYFPQVLRWFDDLASPICRDFLERWPTLPHLQAEDPEQVRRFFHQHGSRSAQRIETRLGQIREAKPLTQDDAIIVPAVTVVRTMLAVAAALNDGIGEMEKSIEKVQSSHPDSFIFASFPGAGAAMAPRLLAAFGSRRERFASANEILSFSGIAPVMEASGQQRWIHFRWACPKFVRQTFHEYAGLSIQQCAWAREFYDKQKAKGKGHHAAVRSLAFKWIRILFRCWKSHQTYNDSLYLAARRARACPLPIATADPAPHSRPASPLRGKRENTRLKSVGEILKFLMTEA